MKVIHFIASIDKSAGGTAAYMKLLAEEINSEELQIIVATGFSENPIDFFGVEIKFFNIKLKRWFALEKEFIDFLSFEKPDLVHINGIWNPQNWLFQKVAQNLGIKVIISPHGMLETYILNRNPLKKKIALMLYQNKALKSADYFHATAKEEKISINALGFKKPIHIIPNGINLTDINKLKSNYLTRKIVFFSRIHPKKGVEILIEAWRNIPNNDWILEIAGNGDELYINKLKQSAKDLKNVNFVGPIYGESKWDFLRSADIMVLPTYSENFGIVIAEALAVGVPVITTTGTPWEELISCNCGWWIPVGVEPLKDALIEALNKNEQELIDMGENGRKLIDEKFKIEQVGNQMLNFYRNILLK